MIKKKYKTSNEKIADSKIVTRSTAKNEKTENIAMTGKQESQQEQKSEQANDHAGQQHKETTSDGVGNSTIRRNPLRTCRINNPVDYLARDSAFH